MTPSFNSNASSAILGVVVRDNNGFILGAQCVVSYHVASSFATEAQPAIHGLNFASDLGFQWVEVEGDSRAVVTKLLSASSDTSEISALIGEAKGLARNFRDCKFVFRNCGGNVVAHSLAHLRGELATDTIWVEEAPWQIELLAAEDRRFPPKPRKGDEFNSELVEILSGEAKVVDVELG
ncbi:hypothetical protein GQ457_10G017370 [Hibiscus cannabinus]